MQFTNLYACPRCRTHWSDEWDCTCDDRCPECNLTVSPYESIDQETYEKNLKIKQETDRK